MKNQKGISLTAAVVALVIVGGLVATVVVTRPKKTTAPVTNANTNRATNLNVVANTNVASNTNAVTNTNTNTATSPEVPAVRYDAPTGPFTTTGSKAVVFSYSKTTDRLVSRLAKVNAATGKTIQTAQISALDLQTALNLPEVPSRPTFFRFGSDGDSALFLMSSTTSYPFVGMYRTSLSTPEKVETIVQYDRDHLLNGDIPTIVDLLYHAETNQAAFVIAGDQSGEKNHLLKVVNLKEKKVRDLGAYATTPQLVGFPQSGELVEVLYADRPQYKEGKNQDVTWSYDQVRLSDAKVVATKLLVDEAGLDNAYGDPHVSLRPDSIAPNNLTTGFSYQRQNADGRSESVIGFRNVNTGKLPDQVIAKYMGSSFVWSPDSGKILVQTYDKGKSFGTIFDLAKGVVDTINGFGQPLLWYPAERIVFSTDGNTLASYDPATKKRLVIFSETGSFGYNEYGGYGNLLSNGIRWVNR